MEAGTLKLEEIEKRIEQLSPEKAYDELQGNGDVVLLDTREPHEYAEAHLENGTLVPPTEVMERIDELAPDTSQRVILYCRTGSRSARAAHQLQEELGYENVANVDGGIVRWQQEGLPVAAAEGMTADQRERYSRHTLLPEFGVEGQVKLLNSKVLLLG